MMGNDINKIRRFSIAVSLPVLAALLIMAAWGYRYLTHPMQKRAPDQIFIVSEGASLKKVAQDLEAAHIISQKGVFLFYARIMGYGKEIKAGEYRLGPGMSPLMILDILRRGVIVSHSVTIPEGFNRKQIAALLEKKGLALKEAVLSVTEDKHVVKHYGLNVSDLEGFLYPDTYQFGRGLSVTAIVDVMVGRFFEIFHPFQERLKQVGMTMEQMVILASIVEKETGKPEERPIIASVFLNRLSKHMRLESDPTVIYGIKNFDGNLKREDLDRHNPYNTYVIRGLPPGAIANPGKDAIQAVLYPADTNFLYFVAKNDGSHYFSETLTEHNRAVRIYQKNRGS